MLCNTFDLHKAIIGLEKQLSVFFLSGRLKHSSFSSLVQSLLPKDTLLRTYLLYIPAHMIKALIVYPQNLTFFQRPMLCFSVGLEIYILI